MSRIYGALSTKEKMVGGVSPLYGFGLIASERPAGVVLAQPVPLIKAFISPGVSPISLTPLISA